MVRRYLLAVAVVAFVLGQIVVPAVSAAAGSGTQRVIVVLREQHPDLAVRSAAPRRQRAVAADQAPVLAALRDGGATNVLSLNLVNAVAATTSSAQVARLRADPAVAAVVPDLPLRRRAAASTTSRPSCPARGRRKAVRSAFAASLPTRSWLA